MSETKSGIKGLQVVVLATALIGAAVVIGAVVAERRIASGNDEVPVAATAEYGRQLLRNTAAHLGPDQIDPERRFIQSRMACASCHLETGTAPGTLSLLETSTRYPRFSGRDGGEQDLRDRINGCMTRSMNGRELAKDSLEMIAMETYIMDLGRQFAATGETRRAYSEPAPFQAPERAADLQAGALVYEERCLLCHGKDGEGLKATANPADGFLFPPLWGPDSFNNGAGMARVLTAAGFIKARMPLGDTDLSDEQAFDVAAFINSKPRPEMSKLELDYPDRTLKPIDSPYPPYADPFPVEQHRFGPFGPIREFYSRQ